MKTGKLPDYLCKHVTPVSMKTPKNATVAEQVAAANAQVKRKILRVWIILGLTLLMTVGFVLFIVLFPRIFHSTKFVTMDWVAMEGKPTIVTLWAEYSNTEDDGECLSGYELRSHDPQSGKQLGKMFLERSLDMMPSEPDLFLGEGGDVWVVQAEGNYQPAPSFLRHVRLGVDGQFLPTDESSFKGLVPVGSFLQGAVSVLNTYKEPGCFDLKTEKLKEGSCDWPGPPSSNSAFFLVNKTSGSTRSKLWHLTCPTVAPPPQIAVGTVSGDRPLDGVHVLNDLFSNRYQVTEERLGYYQTGSNPSTHQFQQLTQGDYLTDAILKFQDADVAVIQLPTGQEGEFDFRLIDASGWLVWTARVTDLANPYDLIDLRRFEDQDILMSGKDFVMGIYRTTGKVLWRFNP